MSSNASFDWRVVFFASLTCYVIPWFVISMISAVLRPPAPEGVAVPVEGLYLWWTGFSVVLFVVGLPLAAGYFTAVYANNRPQMHVLVVAVVGYALFAFAHPNSLATRAVQAAIWLSLAALGAFFVLRRRRHGP